MTSGNLWQLNLASVPQLTELSIVVDWQDRGTNYRVVIPRAMISQRGVITLQRTTATEFELTFDALDYSGQLGYDPNVQINDPSTGH